MNKEQMMARLSYCAKDVYTMALVYKEIEKYATRIPGLRHSISTVMDAIVPYLFSTLRGVKFTPETIIETGKENDKLMMQYNRVINMLIGDKCIGHLEQCVKGKRKMFAGSNVQCVEYFHNLLEYIVVARSAKTQKPSLGKKAMYKLALQHPDNPVIQMVLAFRKLQKEQGTLKFIPWLDDNGKRGTESVLEHNDEPELHL
jgi:DNA polymerase I-like protein with 3'-5' exonuclease and polymerase domains